MTHTLTLDSPGLTDVPGFTAAGIGCDVRGKGDLKRRDLALVFSASPCTAAGVFTTNDVKAAPVLLDQQILGSGGAIHGFVANSGNANACTGQQGMADARAMVARAEAATGSPTGSFFVCSTGRIGRALPMENMLRGIDQAATTLAGTPTAGTDAAWAILTSDTRPKTVTARFTINGQTVTLAGMAKGAGMIEPNMATMLAFIATDARASQGLLQQILKSANEDTFNAITVDGDMSTNDTVLVFANGVSGVDLDNTPDAREAFSRALRAVCHELALKIAGDGERITKLVRVAILGAPDKRAAEKIARAIGNSLLVKTSWYGNDPNWGRVLDAAGYARTGLVESKVDFHYTADITDGDCPGSGAVPVLLQGEPQDANLSRWKSVVAGKRFTLTLNLNLGPGSYILHATDLSEGYVDFNKSE